MAAGSSRGTELPEPSGGFRRPGAAYERRSVVCGGEPDRSPAPEAEAGAAPPAVALHRAEEPLVYRLRPAGLDRWAAPR